MKTPHITTAAVIIFAVGLGVGFFWAKNKYSTKA